MNFDKLVGLYEAKGTKPGERYFNARNSNGASGITSSPIGKSNYNPEKPEFVQRDPADTGMADVANIYRVLSKALALLKDDDTFEDQIKGILNGFKRNRKQISIEQETILKNYDKYIDRYDGLISQYTKRLFAASDTFYHTEVKKSKSGKMKQNVTSYQSSGKQNSTKEELEAELENAKEKKDMYLDILNTTREETESLSQENEKLNEEYLHQFLLVVTYTTNRLYKKLADALGEQQTKQFSTVVPLHELDIEKLEKEVNKLAETQLKLLEMLMSEDSATNPLLAFLEVAEVDYDTAKERSYHLKNGDNYSIIIEQLYKNLPLFKLSNYYYSVVMKKPAIALNTAQTSMVNKKNNVDGGILAQLDKVKSETQFEKLKPDILKYLDTITLSPEQKNAIISLVNGKFIARKGAPNAAFKIRSSLKSASITESFDVLAGSMLSSIEFDEDDFKIDLIEVLMR